MRLAHSQALLTLCLIYGGVTSFAGTANAHQRTGGGPGMMEPVTASSRKQATILGAAKKFSKRAQAEIYRTFDKTKTLDDASPDPLGSISIHTESITWDGGQRKDHDFHVTLSGKKRNKVETIEKVVTNYGDRGGNTYRTVTHAERRWFKLGVSKTTSEYYYPGSATFIPRETHVRRAFHLGTLRIPLSHTYKEGS